MKTLKSFLYSILILVSNIAFAQTPTYNLYANNFHRLAPDSLTFDIRLVHTNPDAVTFQYSAGQYYFKFNTAFANGGTLKYRIIETELPVSAVPVNPTVTGDELRLAPNLPVSQTEAPIISSTLPGTLVVRLSLKTTASSFDNSQPINLQWKNSVGFYTKVAAFVGSVVTFITTPATHFVDTATVSINPVSSIIPVEYELFQNYPNPFNPETKIKFNIPANSSGKSGEVKLIIYNSIGKEISTLVNDFLNPGSYEVKWNASNIPSGIYFYRIQSEDFSETKRMMLIK